MTWGDRITILVAAGAITATVAAGTCSPSTRFAETQADIRQVRENVKTDIRELHAEVQTGICELRAPVIDAVQGRLSTSRRRVARGSRAGRCGA